MKVGLFGVGLKNYWDQFQELKKALAHNLDLLGRAISRYHPDIMNLGLIDNVDNAFLAGETFRKSDVGIIFLYVTTYSLSSTVVPVVQRLGVPVIVLNISPEKSINYEKINNLNDRVAMTGEWLKHCSSCPIPELSNVFNRIGIQFYQITGVLNDPKNSCWNEIREWIEAAKVADTMYNNRLGLMGHYYGGMLDIYTDLTNQYKYFGGHIEIIEVDELSEIRKSISEKEIDEKQIVFNSSFEIQNDCDRNEIKRAAKTSIALDKLVKKYKLGSLAYFYSGYNGSDNEDTMSSVILGNSLLTAQNIPVAGEYEVKNAQAMKIMDSFDAGGSFTEYYAVDYNDNVVLMGHDGPGHIAIAEGKTKVRPLYVYHGKVGRGLSVEMSIRHGEVTLLSVVEDEDNKLFFLTAEGESVDGPILEIGNTNSRYRFPIGAQNFMERWNSFGPAHHWAVGVGHIASKIEKLGKILGMQTIKVC